MTRSDSEHRLSLGESARTVVDDREADIKALVDTFPPLTREQRDRLASLLRSRGGGT